MSNAYTLTAVNMRKTPGYVDKPADDKITTIPEGTAISIGQSTKKDDLNWYSTVWGDYSGWCAEADPSGNKLLSMGNKPADIIDSLSAQYGINVRLARAVVAIESGGNVNAQRFEPAVFIDRYAKLQAQNLKFANPAWKGCQIFDGDEWIDTHVNIDNTKLRLEQIWNQAYLESNSWGLGQIMGFNYATCGYQDVFHFVNEILGNRDKQISAMFKFMSNSKDSNGKSCIDHLKSGDLVAFARIYNGIGQEEYYAGLIRGRM